MTELVTRQVSVKSGNPEHPFSRREGFIAPDGFSGWIRGNDA
jgi:hypothetical protein